jgi:hypothetical protein
VVEDPGFAASQPYAQTFLDSMAIVKDFWAEPTYAELLLAMQRASTTTSWPARHGAGGARRAGARLDRGLRGRRQALTPAPGAGHPLRAGAPAHRACPAIDRAEVRSGKTPMEGRRMSVERPRTRRAGDAAAGRARIRGLSDRAIAWIFIAPTIVLLLAVNIFPLIWTIRLSFTNFRANRPNAEVEWVGLRNYQRILTDPDIWQTMQATAHFLFWTLFFRC